ncbi:MAG: molybdopterin molybdotransferase MoeA [Acidobacteria bacterium]|nr:molybdopterin molybdotransferase MoeA [Acidobacteriota bacterium]MBV9474436.1 molybdopterin molybdotransferase MoeA [Acidobacteriota bacterium]
MIRVEEAQERVLAEVAAGPIEAVPLGAALGRVLRENVAAAYDAPERDNSAMDGYALRAEDVANVPATLRVTGTIAAGHPIDARVEPGTAMRIMTGAYVPDGADTVVQVELTDGGVDSVRIDRALTRGANIRRRGSDMRAGDVVLRAGTRIGPAEVAMLAAMQKSRVDVGRRPTVAIFSTGDELVEFDAPRAAGQIVNTNGPLLEALVRDAGALPRNLGVVRDTREATIAALEAALESDFVLSSGGVSVGAFDFVKDALESLGAETKFWRVAMKPGKPVVLSRLRDRVVFGLPGNPVSCFVSFHLFVAPALRKAMGQETRLLPPSVRARAAAPLRSAGDRRVYVRVRVTVQDGELFAEPLATQGSGALTSMVGANGLAVVEERVTRIEKGEGVGVVMVGAL